MRVDLKDCANKNYRINKVCYSHVDQLFLICFYKRLEADSVEQFTKKSKKNLDQGRIYFDYVRDISKPKNR